MTHFITLNVPFIYEAKVIKSRCRKPVVELVRDTVDVTIKQCTEAELPPAIRVVGFERDDTLRWDGHRLYDYAYVKATDQPNRVVNIQEAIDNTVDCTKYKYSSSGPAAPFHNFWHRIGQYGSNYELKSAWLKDTGIDEKSNIVRRKWVSDNRDEVIALAKSIAMNMLVMDGMIMAPASEPTYYTITFGMGNNHASTALMLGSYNPKVKPERFDFNANQLNEAIAYTTNTASARGDTKSLPIKPHAVIDVLIPESISMPENKYQSTIKPDICEPNH